MQLEKLQPERVAGPIEHLLAMPVIERVDIPARPAKFAAAPAQFAHGALGQWLKRSLGASDRLYLHQALAFASIEQDLNVVVATATASGKSLVFMGAALRKILAGKSRVLVFYTQKALGSDQLGRWQRELKHAGLSPELVAEINGDIPVAEREQVLANARIVLATPDVIHAWMMPSLSSPAVKRFLRHLDLLILDEAHALEAVFGSHASLFIRRLRLAYRLSAGTPSRPCHDDFQVVAATATLADPTAQKQLSSPLPTAARASSGSSGGSARRPYSPIAAAIPAAIGERSKPCCTRSSCLVSSPRRPSSSASTCRSSASVSRWVSRPVGSRCASASVALAGHEPASLR